MIPSGNLVGLMQMS